jgi:hypothetical protein
MGTVTTPKSPIGDHVRELRADERLDARKLMDAEVLAFARKGYAIASAQYFEFDGAIPWVAIATTVKNQMAERSIARQVPSWNDPGYDFVELYPQPSGVFAVAMAKSTAKEARRVVGYYVLKMP